MDKFDFGRARHDLCFMTYTNTYQTSNHTHHNILANRYIIYITEVKRLLQVIVAVAKL
jgi:hypothetical protein